MGYSLKKHKVGLFGGSFDPFHFGHLNLVLSLLEHAQLDRVLVCPAKNTAFKTPYTLIEHRVHMLQLVIEEIPQLALLDWEIQREKPYTIDTVKRLKKNTNADFFLLLGEDLLPNLHLWHQAEELLHLSPPLIGSRFITPKDINLQLSPQAQAKVKAGFVKIPLMEISGSVVRKRIQQRKFCKHLVPLKVLDYIQSNNLYCSSYENPRNPHIS